jgi:hypothetical protein
LLSQLDAKGKAWLEQERLNKSAQRLQIRIIDCCQRSNKKKLKETLSNAIVSGKGTGRKTTYPWKTNYCLIPVVGSVG